MTHKLRRRGAGQWATVVACGVLMLIGAVARGADLLSSRATVRFLTAPNWSATPDEADARQLVDETSVAPNGHWIETEMVGWRGVELVRLEIALEQTENLGALELELPVGLVQDVKSPRTVARPGQSRPAEENDQR